jgi:hypothetical protein
MDGRVDLCQWWKDSGLESKYHKDVGIYARLRLPSELYVLLGDQFKNNKR